MLKGRKNKGMVVGQIVVYILSLLIFGLIIYYGYNAIQQFWENQQLVELLEFKNRISKDINELSRRDGDVKVFNPEKPLRAPGRYKELCFIQLKENGVPTNPPSNLYPLIKNSWEGQVKENIFLVIEDMEESFFVERLKVDNNNKYYDCFTINDGRITDLRIKGEAGFARISHIQN